jgi:hypothetical protein
MRLHRPIRRSVLTVTQPEERRLIEGAIDLVGFTRFFLVGCHVKRFGRRPAAQNAFSYSSRPLEISNRTHAISRSWAHNPGRSFYISRLDVTLVIAKAKQLLAADANLNRSAPHCAPYYDQPIEGVSTRLRRHHRRLFYYTPMSPRSGIFSPSRTDGYLNVLRLAFYMT